MFYWFSLASALTVLCALAGAPAAAFSIYHSPLNDGVSKAVPEFDPGATIDLNLWFDPGQLVFGYSGVFLTADSPGIAIVSFSPEADVLSSLVQLDAGDGEAPDDPQPDFERLGIDGGDVTNGDSEPRRIGTLRITFENTPGGLFVTQGAFTNADFESVSITPLPQLVAGTPEPSTALMLAAGVAWLTAARRRI